MFGRKLRIRNSAIFVTRYWEWRISKCSGSKSASGSDANTSWAHYNATPVTTGTVMYNHRSAYDQRPPGNTAAPAAHAQKWRLKSRDNGLHRRFHRETVNHRNRYQADKPTQPITATSNKTKRMIYTALASTESCPVGAYQWWRLTFTVQYSKIKQGVQLWLYFDVFHTSDLWQDINDATILFFLLHVGAQLLSAEYALTCC